MLANFLYECTVNLEIRISFRFTYCQGLTFCQSRSAQEVSRFKRYVAQNRKWFLLICLLHCKYFRAHQFEDVVSNQSIPFEHNSFEKCEFFELNFS